MPLSTTAALKARLDAVDPDVPVVSGDDPRPRLGNFISIEEGISLTLDDDGDFGDPAASRGVTEEAQVDVWQRRRGMAGEITEDLTLPEKVIRALHGRSLTSNTGHIYGCRVRSAPRFTEENGAVVHHAITVEIRRDL